MLGPEAELLDGLGRRNNCGEARQTRGAVDRSRVARIGRVFRRLSAALRIGLLSVDERAGCQQLGQPGQFPSLAFGPIASR